MHVLWNDHNVEQRKHLEHEVVSRPSSSPATPVSRRMSRHPKLPFGATSVLQSIYYHTVSLAQGSLPDSTCLALVEGLGLDLPLLLKTIHYILVAPADLVRQTLDHTSLLYGSYY